jgi:glycosyltransferase involved in cell wall biosynthesis
MTGSGNSLRILQVHDSYAPGWGGEDTVLELERHMLCDRGHAVEQFRTSHAALKNMSVVRQMLAVPGFFWSRSAYRALQEKIGDFQPAVVHVHNSFPQLSPSVFWAAHRAGVPVIQTLHNFRHVCAGATLLRDGKTCERCVGRPPWAAVRYGCYGASRARTAVVVAVNWLHSQLGTYRRVNTFVVLNDFNREVFRRANFPVARMATKANFVPLPPPTSGDARNQQAVFVGAISQGKGVPLLLEAWDRNRLAQWKLVLIGDGPEREALERQWAHRPDIEWCGKLERREVLKRVAASRWLVFPSLAYENCPMVVLEALSVGTPVIAADHPSLRAMIRNGSEGLLFRPGSPEALALALETGLGSTHETWAVHSSAARQAHAERYSEEENYRQLISIYQSAIAGRAACARTVETRLAAKTS